MIDPMAHWVGVAVMALGAIAIVLAACAATISLGWRVVVRGLFLRDVEEAIREWKAAHPDRAKRHESLARRA